MDIVRFKGGLGNQMFQYALIEALRNNDRDVYCSLGFYQKHPDLRPFILDKIFRELNLLEIKEERFEEIDKKWNKIKTDKKKLNEFVKNPKDRFFYVENEDGKYDPDVFLTENCTFVGYWQSEKYFKDIRKKLLKLYSFKNLEPNLLKFGNYIRNKYISVHVRRGDYLKYDLFHTFQIDYYYKAMEYVSRIMPGVPFVFFSNDMEWVKYHFNKTNIIICEAKLFEHYEDWYDMYFMTLCRGNIIANSSFSWWGAWLNKNTAPVVLAPNKWFNGLETPDIWCDNWIRI